MRQGLSKRMCGHLAGCLALVVAFSGGSAAAASSLLGASGTVGAVATSDAVVSGTFVGKADGALVGVAVIARKPAAEGQARAISVYVCNGTSLAVWLTGMTAGNEAGLRSADGRVGVNVVLAAQTASGKVGVLGGSGFRFTVPRAAGIAGLFDVTVAASGLLRGKSSTGATLTGRLGGAAKLPADGTVVATASAGGREVKLTAPARHITAGAYRWIVLTDRKVYGASRRGPGLGGIGGFVRPTGGKHIRIKDAGSAGQKGYDDKKCRSLANDYNILADKAIKGGPSAAANNKAADAAYENLTDHCLVVA